MKKDAWNKFKNTGSIEDYLNYKRKQKNYLNEMGSEVIIKDSKRDSNGRSNRRNHSKK
ncbi:hypothetical protein [Haloplasma contractile]|uniref:Uncharacterized protein n=1 Tax=Haloplasma contractile SSD-17B TaxID=1033810 RepID=U2FM69_9MOLU|nr:hypothetical protein [Haloplasma contractile]ERJ13820.1 hypothetical protein HLPCO_000486 [Haloplasma contractile SSD-17B]